MPPEQSVEECLKYVSYIDLTVDRKRWQKYIEDYENWKIPENEWEDDLNLEVRY